MNAFFIGAAITVQPGKREEADVAIGAGAGEWPEWHARGRVLERVLWRWQGRRGQSGGEGRSMARPRDEELDPRLA